MTTNTLNAGSTNLTPIEIMLGVDEQGRTTAKKLYEFLGMTLQHYSEWANKNIVNNQFAIKNEDYEVLPLERENPQGGRPSQDYKLSASFAKKLAMGTHNERGEQAKNYFIAIEDKLKEKALDMSKLSPQTQLILQLSQSIARAELEAKEIKQIAIETKQEVQAIKDIIIINPKAEWRDKTNKILTAIGYQTNEYHKIREWVYLSLEQRARCNLKARLQNLQARALSQGMAPSKVKELNNLDVIENDVRLKEIYIGIVKEMAIKHGVKGEAVS
jgi:anti-repressor protein